MALSLLDSDDPVRHLLGVDHLRWNGDAHSNNPLWPRQNSAKTTDRLQIRHPGRCQKATLVETTASFSCKTIHTTVQGTDPPLLQPLQMPPLWSALSLLCRISDHLQDRQRLFSKSNWYYVHTAGCWSCSIRLNFSTDQLALPQIGTIPLKRLKCSYEANDACRWQSTMASRPQKRD
jgi:hypothetical protein